MLFSFFLDVPLEFLRNKFAVNFHSNQNARGTNQMRLDDHVIPDNNLDFILALARSITLV